MRYKRKILFWEEMKMKKIMKFLRGKGALGAMNALAIATVALGAQQCCYWFFHQPEFPAEADQFRKFK